MVFNEKIEAVVTKNIAEVLKRDCTLFEFFQNNGSENMNRFLNCLVDNYYSFYSDERRKLYNDLTKALREALHQYSTDDDDITKIADSIDRTYLLPPPLKKGHNSTEKLKIRPNEETASTFNIIIMKELNGKFTMSEYFRNMFTSYCKKPLYERERIIFKENNEWLTKACQKHEPIMFTLKWAPKILYRVVPYKLVPGHEEMLNYLLCQITDDKTGEKKTAIFRLSRIIHPKPDHDSTCSLDPNVIARLDRMIRFSPKYLINNDETVCVRLTPKGERIFNRRYHDRPVLDHREEKDEGIFYYFNCSEEQIYYYFRSFEKDDAVIVSPERLRKRMRDFHSDVLDYYKDQ